MLTPAAASETSFGVSAKNGIKLDCVGLYAAETAASRDQNEGDEDRLTRGQGHGDEGNQDTSSGRHQAE